MKAFFVKAHSFMGNIFEKIIGFTFLVSVFLLWGYLHQLFSFSDCGEGRYPNMGIGAVIAAGFGITTCTISPRTK
jgi:hypothetical protein